MKSRRISRLTQTASAGVTDGRTAGLARCRQDSASRNGRPADGTQQQRPTPIMQPSAWGDIMHPTFKELFIEADTDDLMAEEDWRRRVRRSRRARSAVVVRPVAGNRQHRSRP